MSPLNYLPLLCCLGNALASLTYPAQDESSPILQDRSIDKCVDFKIMALGASVTWGTHSTTGNGYRGPLEKLILAGGNNVAFTGTRNNGHMADNAVEAYPGYLISEVQAKSNSSGSYDYQPNVVIIHLGTNDCNLHFDTDNAPTRMVNLVQNLTAAIPDVVVIVSSLIPNLVADVETCILSVNSGFKTEMATLANSGVKVLYADMHSAVPTSDINPVDGTHPNDDGYQKMANVWYKSLRNAAKLLSAPNAEGKTGFVQPQSKVPACAGAVSTSGSSSSTVSPSAAASSTDIKLLNCGSESKCSTMVSPSGVSSDTSTQIFSKYRYECAV
ncbi:Multidomain esterase [Lachnellula hyalina]|uniref:Multidomain esterase n=1 Tax=Lachnellula hyalina TaxID=1316788 RepID=A0A8H8R8G3_9HELO|nr:Multidomain esterase [Lachnellula hyalina]TVY29942.1 Multidomain esterase [Lachnellula hyalina]